jgi:hypothetical protein
MSGRWLPFDSSDSSHWDFFGICGIDEKATGIAYASTDLIAANIISWNSIFFSCTDLTRGHETDKFLLVNRPAAVEFHVREGDSDTRRYWWHCRIGIVTKNLLSSCKMIHNRCTYSPFPHFYPRFSSLTSYDYAYGGCKELDMSPYDISTDHATCQKIYHTKEHVHQDSRSLSMLCSDPYDLQIGGPACHRAEGWPHICQLSPAKFRLCLT